MPHRTGSGMVICSTSRVSPGGSDDDDDAGQPSCWFYKETPIGVGGEPGHEGAYFGQVLALRGSDARARSRVCLGVSPKR